MVLRQASPDVASCARRHALPDGRYLVALQIDPTGKVGALALRESPAALGPAASSCLEAAFTRLRFPGTVPPPETATAPREAPAAHLPGRPRPGRFVSVHWPFVLDLRQDEGRP